MRQQVTELTEQIPNDILFQDQIGARSNYTDYGAFAPTATAYAQGWLEHTRGLSGRLLMTEGGVDRFAETEIGFNGGTFLDEVTGIAVQRWEIALAGMSIPLLRCSLAIRSSSTSTTLRRPA
ncbi:MAG: hypothetical protein HZY76_00445 [Anaerolineae bacterium]|nr:MAG: hypothetical protein HZY76_00445 [Anaerolineae bacterium]